MYATVNASRLVSLLGLAALCALPACSSSPAPPGPDLPGFEGLEQNANNQSGTNVRTPKIAAPMSEAGRIGTTMVELDVALRSWTEAMSLPRDVKNQETVNYAAYAIGAKVAEHRMMLENQAISGAPRNRGIATAALGFAGDPSVLPLLLNNVSSGDPEIVAKALLAVGVLSAEDTSIAPMAEAIRSMPQERAVIRNAAFAMFQLAAKVGTDPDGALSSALLGLVSDEDAAVRAQALLGLGLVRANQALPAISDHLAADPAPSVRTAAAYALGQIGAQASTPALVASLNDPDPYTAGAARAALTRIHGKDLGPEAASWRPMMPRR